LLRVDEAHDFISFEGMMTNFFEQFPAGYARDGHCILGMRPVWDESKGWVVKYANSWGVWGDEGYGYDTRKVVERGLNRYRGGTVIRTIYVPQGLALVG
jgi:hypothetical protein